jgi:hypothetical protein
MFSSSPRNTNQDIPLGKLVSLLTSHDLQHRSDITTPIEQSDNKPRGIFLRELF